MPRKSAARLSIVSQVMTDEEILNEEWILSTLTKTIGKAGELCSLE